MSLEIGEICRAISTGEPLGSLTPYVLFVERLPVGDAEAADGDGCEPIFVLPDLHILSGDRHYGDYFHLNRSREGRLVDLLRRLRDLREGDAAYRRMRLWQIGDFHDLWRERQHWWGEGLDTMLDRQIDSHRDLFALLGELRCERLVGNHDKKLSLPGVLEQLRGHPISDYFPPGSVHPGRHSFAWGAFGRVDMLHGHEVDPAENHWWSDFLNPIGCRFADPDLGIGLTDEWQHEVREDGTVDASLLQDNVVYAPADADSAQEDRQRYYAELATEFNTLGAAAGEELRSRARTAVIIGHTHHPRIVRGAIADRYVLIDGGSWVNQSSPAGGAGGNAPTMWNGQLAILSGAHAVVVQIGVP